MLIDLAPVVAERRAHIRAMARCESCGATRAACDHYRETNDDPTAPGWFGCCARGLLLDTPCRHVEQVGMIRELFDEIEAGAVRTVAEAYPPPVQGPHRASMAWLLDQEEFWQPMRGPMVRIDDMTDTHRLHTRRWLERRAPVLELQDARSGIWFDAPDEVWAEREQDSRDPVGWLRRQPLHRALGRHLPDPSGGKRARKRYRRLLERAAHWSTCPRNRRISANLCICSRREPELTASSGLSA